MVATWLYISTGLIPREEQQAEIDSIVATSRLRNATLDVTGALVWAGENFAQLIEGPAASVAELRKSIMHDPRHTAIDTLEFASDGSRRFSDWSLAYAGPHNFIGREVRRISLSAADGGLDAARDLRRLLVELTSRP